MPRINIELPDPLHKRCKLAATAKGMTLKGYLTEELERGLPDSR